jgi:hypothetical protein
MHIEDPQAAVHFEEECLHYLEIFAEDELNNSIIDNETFNVDDTPPEIEKTVGTPNCGPYCVIPSYLDFGDMDIPMEYTLVPSNPNKPDVSGTVYKYMDEENVIFEIFINEQFNHTEFQLVFSEYKGDGIHSLPRNSKWKVGWMPGESTQEPLIGYNDGTLYV